MIFISYLFIFSLRFLNMFMIPILKSWSCDSAKLILLHITTGLLTSVEGILSWLFNFVFLCWGLGIWSYDV